MTRCRLSAKGKARGFQPRNQDREGEYLGPGRTYIGRGPDGKSLYETDETTVQVLWDGVKHPQGYHRDFIEIIDDTKSEERER